MTESISSTDRAAIDAIVANMETAWNGADGEGFASAFADDADFVTVRAEHIRGREAIAAGHSAILQSIYAGSTNRYTIDAARLLSPDIALVHVRAELENPSGPLAGRHSALFSLVLNRSAEGWTIVSLHNTMTPPGGPPKS